MEISSFSSSVSPQIQAGALSGATDVATDFETFLRMLTVQAQNQDPLDPVKASDYAAQLAQFSMVEQQVRSNELLASLAEGAAAGDLARLSHWIGLEAQVAGPVEFDGQPMTVELSPRAEAERLSIVAMDAAGQERSRLQIAALSGEYRWNGTDAEGMPLVPGSYYLTLESHSAAGLIGNDPLPVKTRIEGVKADGHQMRITLGNGQSVPEEQIVGLAEL